MNLNKIEKIYKYNKLKLNISPIEMIKYYLFTF